MRLSALIFSILLVAGVSAQQPTVVATGQDSTAAAPHNSSAVSPENPSSRVYKVGGSVSPPTAVVVPDPEVPASLRVGKYQGTVLLFVIVDENGTPRSVKVVRSLTEELDEKAVQAVTKWRFEPARKNGKPVAVQIHVEVNFRFDDPPYRDLMQKIVDRANLRDEAAMKQIQRAAESGNIESELVLGCLLNLGSSARVKSKKTFPYDTALARRYFESAARAGSAEAQFLLAMNAVSSSKTADFVEPATWLNIAAAFDFKPAKR